MKNYIKNFATGVGSLLVGLKVTGREFFTKKVTEQYPENRETLQMFERFRGTLAMTRNEKGELKCIACGLCQNTCPNGTIKIEWEEVVDPESGKKRKQLLRYGYDLGMCMFMGFFPPLPPKSFTTTL